MVVRSLAVALVLVFSGCGGGDDGGDDVDGDGGEIINGCPTHREPLAQPGDPIDGDTYETFASGFFTSYCTRCHSTTRTGADRNGAPDGFNWDDETSVAAHRTEMRNAIGVMNFMPIGLPKPSCDERARLVRWIDANNP